MTAHIDLHQIYEHWERQTGHIEKMELTPSLKTRVGKNKGLTEEVSILG